MRHVILDLSKTKSKPLVSLLKRSRLSVPTVFGSIAESFHQDFVIDRSHNSSKKFPQLDIPEWKNVFFPASLLSYKSKQGPRRGGRQPFRDNRASRSGRRWSRSNNRQPRAVQPRRQFARIAQQPFIQQQQLQQSAAPTSSRPRGRGRNNRNQNRGNAAAQQQQQQQ